MTILGDAGIDIRGDIPSSAARMLTPAALEFVARLQREFGPRRTQLLHARVERQARLDAGERPVLLPSTSAVRAADWRVADAPRDLLDRRVEITGPAEPKMMINALNSGASVFMADFEDALSPTWANIVDGQAAVAEAVRRTLSYDAPDGKAYRLNGTIATLVIRPRGWHLPERHVLVDGEPVSASLFDAGLFLFHNARELLDRGSGPYLYLPKLEGHLEARLWNDVFGAAQDLLGIPQGSIRATALIETILAAFEMDEILFELRAHAAGLNAGRWDYLFSIIKKLRAWRLELPDRAQLAMTVPFMRAYTDLLVRTCHRRGAHAIGGMAAFIPSRRDADVNERALVKVRDDKLRESGDGFDGTWVAHPDLVPVAREVFDTALDSRPNQKDRLREDVDVRIRPDDLLDIRVDGGAVTEAGVRGNVRVAIAYLASWLRGTGAAAIDNLMEDAATAEIARSELWHWRSVGARIDDGRAVDSTAYRVIRDDELRRLRSELGVAGSDTRSGAASTGTDGADASGDGGQLASIARSLDDAARLLDRLVLGEEFVEFLTLPAYPMLP